MLNQSTNQPFVREAAPKRIFKREGKLEINPLLLQAFGITPEELGDVIKSAEEPEAMRDMFAFLSDYATLSDRRTRLSISGDKLDFLVADLKRRMGRVAEVYRRQAEEHREFGYATASLLSKTSDKARELSNFRGMSREDKVAFIDAVVGLEHTSGSIIPIAFGITDYGREDYWPRKLLVFLRSHGMPGMVREGSAPNNSQPKINWNLNIREGRIVYMPPEEYMERVNIFNRIGMSRAIENERKAIGKGYRGIGYYPPLSEQSYKSILEGIRAGNEMDIPNIVYRNGMVDNQEGFHRSLVARDIGIEKIPVHVIGEMPSVFSRALNLNWNQNLTEQVKAINALKGKVIGGVSMISEAITPASEPADKEFRANPGLINKQAAYAAHTGTSFEPEKRGEQAIRGFAEEVQAMYERLKPHARTDAEKALLISEMERFQASYAQKYNDLLYSHSRIYSTMIAGPSGFPAERMRKINEAYDKKAHETYEWKDRAEKAMLRALKGLATEEAGGELAVLKNKIAQAEKLQEMMVEANKIIRKKAEPGIGGISKHQQLINMGFTERQATEAMTPDYMRRTGFPAFALTNNSANIRRMKERLIELEKKEVTPTAEIPFTGGYISDNREEDRVQIFFDQKPQQAMIDKLKSEGWRWAPSVGAWSRKRTDMAMNSARRILGLEAQAPKFIIPASVALEEEGEEPEPQPTERDSTIVKRQIEAIGVKVLRAMIDPYNSGQIRLTVPTGTQPLPGELRREVARGFKGDIPSKTWVWLLRPKPPSPVSAPQPQAVQELRWVYGTQDEKWHLVVPEDRDYVHGITQERMKIIGQEAAKAEYLNPSLARAAAPAQQVSAVPGKIDNVIALMEQYVKDGKTYEDFVAGLKGYYLPQSGYQINNHLDAEKLKADLEKAGYYTLTELWNDTSRKLRMRMYVPPKHPPLLYPAPVSPEVKKYTTPRTFKKGTIARNNITNEKFVLEMDVEALQEDKNAMIWRTNEGHHIYIDDQRPAAIPIKKEPDKISSDDTQILKSYEKISDYAINQRITLNQGKLKELAARRVVRIEKGQYGTMGSAYLEQERLGISEEISRLRRVLDLRELIAAQARPEPWKLTQEEYWRAGAEGKAYEGRGTSDFTHKGQVVLALAQNKAVSPEVLKDYPDIVARIRQENEALLAKDKAERDRLLAIERIEENELNVELNKLPPSLKRHAETEIYGTLHMPDTHKDYRNRYYIALGKVRMIAFAHLPKSEKKEEPAEPLSDYDRVLKAYLENRGYELTLQDFIWADKYTLRGTARHIVASEAEKKRRQDYISKTYNEDVGKKLHRGVVVSALEQGIKVPDIVLKDYPDLMKKEVPEPTDYFTLKKAQELSRENKLKLSDEQLREKSIKVQDYIRLIEGTDEYSRKTLIKGGYYQGLIHPDASGKVPVDIWLLQNLKFTLGEFDKEQQRRKQEKIKISVPTVPVAKPVQSIQDIKQQVINSIQEAKSMDELKQILKGLGFLPLPESEKRQLIDLYQIRLSELMGGLKFGERIPEEEKKKRRAPQKAPYAPPTRRLEEYGIKEAMRRGYGYA